MQILSPIDDNGHLWSLLMKYLSEKILEPLKYLYHVAIYPIILMGASVGYLKAYLKSNEIWAYILLILCLYFLFSQAISLISDVVSSRIIYRLQED